jgi:hypothetical protein
MSRNSNDQGVVLTGAKQTMAAWSKVIESYETVPVIYKVFFETQFTDNQPFPYVVFTPSLVKPRGKTNENLVCDAYDAIHILERNGSQIVTKSYPYQTVCTVEVGSILLSSWLTISGITSAGEASVSTINFNTTSTRYFETFLNKLRPVTHGVGEAEFNAEKDKFNYLSAINFKLMNFGRSSLVHGEIVLHSLLQSEIREPIWTFLGSMFQRTISPAHLTILTNQELILIQDIEHSRETPRPPYGGVWHYIPLRSIKSALLSEAENERLTLSITVSPDKTIEKLFVVSSKPELVKLCAQLQKRIGESHAFV